MIQIGKSCHRGIDIHIMIQIWKDIFLQNFFYAKISYSLEAEFGKNINVSYLNFEHWEDNLQKDFSWGRCLMWTHNFLVIAMSRVKTYFLLLLSLCLVLTLKDRKMRMKSIGYVSSFHFLSYFLLFYDKLFKVHISDLFEFFIDKSIADSYKLNDLDTH